MEPFKIIKTVTSNSVTVDHLEKYNGKKVEIIIFPFEKDKLESDKEKEYSYNIRGTLKQYANPNLIDKEKSAWANVVKEKHAAD